MPDYAPYTEEEFFAMLATQCDKGGHYRPCERCGNKTKTGRVFGMIICTPCWNKQTRRT